jgi:class 3 adenylate cyclase
VTICPQCGQRNPDGARFCNLCATPLTEREPGREVLKTVTVLFCDVVGSTELGERFDPEVVRAMMARFYAAIREPVERRGGTVEKVIGDALMAVFGIPVVHEDDALQAVLAAIEMRDAVLALGDIDARIGVNTGDVLARDAIPGESLVVGDAVNVAARLEQAAGPGEVLVGDATWTLVAHAAGGERVAPIAAKGKREPLVAWRLHGVDPAARGHRRRLDLPMVGRGAELDLVRWALERTQTTCRPHLVTVLGQPGIGKSRLVADIPRLGDGLAVLTGQCRRGTGASSLEPLLEVARAALADGPDIPTAVRDRMPADPDADAVAACLQNATAAGAADVAWALMRLIGAMAATGPVVVVLEDLHWADDRVLDIVEQLLADTRRRSLLIVCTARPELADRRPGWGAGTNSMSLTLERLDDAQTRLLLSQAAPGLPPADADRVVAVAEGNPLFAEHLAAVVGDHDAPDGLPRSIQVLLTARLEGLPEPEREVLSVAAVAGRDFPVASVEALIGRPITAELDHLARRELIEPAGSGRQQFEHALLQEAAYGLITKQRRSELHARLARLLDADGAGDAVVGDHLERAFQLRATLGEVDAGTMRIGEEAGTRLAAAGMRADALGDPVRARALLERSLALLPEDGAAYAAAMVELAAAGWNALSDAEVKRMLHAAADLAAGHGLRALELRARILLLGAGGGEDGGEAPPDLEILAQTESALRELETLADPRATATALCTRGSIECSLGRGADAVASSLRAIDLLRAGEYDTVWPLRLLGWAVVESPLPVAEADALLHQLMDELGVRPTVRSELVVAQALLAQLRGDADAAWALFDAARGLERDLSRGPAWNLRDSESMLLLRSERWEEARVVLRSLVAERERNGARDDELADIRSRLALAEVRAGDTEAALAATRAAGDVEGYEARTRVHQALAEIHLARADIGAAVESARRAVAVAGRGDWVLLQAEAELTLARTLHAAGDPAADAARGRAAGLYAAKGYAGGVAQADRLAPA